MTPLQQVMLQGQQVPTVEADGGDAGILNQAQPQPVLAQPEAAPQQAPSDWYQMKAPTAGDWGNALTALGRGFSIAGSQNPAQTYHDFVRSDREAAELKKARYQQIPNTPYFYMQKPDGSFSVVDDQGKQAPPNALSKYLGDLQGAKFEQAIQKILLQSQAGVNAANDKETFKKLEEKAGGVNASTEFNPQVQSNIEKLDKLHQWVTSGEADKVGGYTLPKVAKAIDDTWGSFFGTPNATQRQTLDTFLGKSVLEQAQQMRGSLSDKDVVFLKEMNVKSDSTPERKAEYIKEFSAALKRGEEERMQAARAIREGKTSSNPQSANSVNNVSPRPAAGSISSDVYSSKAPSEWGSYDPNAYEYRMNNGVLQRRKK